MLRVAVIPVGKQEPPSEGPGSPASSMASEAQASSSNSSSTGRSATVSTPSALGSTTLPKETLSFRWVINNARIFLANIGQGRTEGLKSPRFLVHEPQRTNLVRQYSGSNSKWYLLIERLKGARDRELALHDAGDNRQHKTSQLLASSWYSISLCHSNGSSAVSKIALSKCIFSFLHSNTSRVQRSIKARECVGSASQESCIAVHFMKYEDISGYVSSDTLSIQVNATLLYFTDPIEGVDEPCKLPPDDIRKDMQYLLKSEALADVTIRCGEKKFKAHKMVLAAQSPVFRKTFEANLKERRSNDVIEISDISPSVVSDLLYYLYTGNVHNLNSLAKDLLNAANKYDIPRLFLICENELTAKIKASNVVEVLLLADVQGAVHLKTACLKFIQCNTVAVHKTSGWKSLKENLSKHASLLVEIMEFIP